MTSHNTSINKFGIKPSINTSINNFRLRSLSTIPDLVDLLN